jgi:hypothetical protein
VDSDFILLVGEISGDSIYGVRGPTTVLYPELCDAPAIKRSRMLGTEVRSSSAMKRSRLAAEEPVWLAGVLFTIGVILDSKGSPLAAWFGPPKEVEQAGLDWMEGQLKTEIPPQSPDLTIVSLHAENTTWQDLSAAIWAARRIAPECSEFAIVTSLAEPPGPALRRLAESQLTGTTLSARGLGDSADSVPAAIIDDALQAARVYLLSRLSCEAVESLGIIPIASEKELINLTRRFKKILVIEDADRRRI